MMRNKAALKKAYVQVLNGKTFPTIGVALNAAVSKPDFQMKQVAEVSGVEHINTQKASLHPFDSEGPASTKPLASQGTQHNDASDAPIVVTAVRAWRALTLPEIVPSATNVALLLSVQMMVRFTASLSYLMLMRNKVIATLTQSVASDFSANIALDCLLIRW